MKKFKNVEEAIYFLIEQYGWTTLSAQDFEPYIKMEKPDGEVELIHKDEVENVALEMWEATKQNGLSEDLVESVEIDYFYDHKLDELYQLTLIQNERKLTEDESKRCVEIVGFLQENNVPIEFGIEM